jgi:hypothetical protein
MIKTHPFDNTMIGLFEKLKTALKMRQEADIQITANTAAIRALANACEDEEFKAVYLVQLEELTGKPGFMDAVRKILRERRNVALTPSEIAGWIHSEKIMDLSNYSNAQSSIHTTLRRLKDKGEIEEVTNNMREKAYRYKFTPGEEAMRKALGRKR